MRDNRRKSANVRLFQFILMTMALLGASMAQADDEGADEPDPRLGSRQLLRHHRDAPLHCP